MKLFRLLSPCDWLYLGGAVAIGGLLLWGIADGVRKSTSVARKPSISRYSRNTAGLEISEAALPIAGESSMCPAVILDGFAESFDLESHFSPPEPTEEERAFVARLTWLLQAELDEASDVAAESLAESCVPAEGQEATGPPAHKEPQPPLVPPPPGYRPAYFDSTFAPTAWLSAATTTSRNTLGRHVRQMMAAVKNGQPSSLALADRSHAAALGILEDHPSVTYLYGLIHWEAGRTNAALRQFESAALGERPCLPAQQARLHLQIHLGEFVPAAAALPDLAQRAADFKAAKNEPDWLAAWLGRASAALVLLSQARGVAVAEEPLKGQLTELLPLPMRADFDAHYRWCRNEFARREQQIAELNKDEPQRRKQEADSVRTKAAELSQEIGDLESKDKVRRDGTVDERARLQDQLTAVQRSLSPLVRDFENLQARLRSLRPKQSGSYTQRVMVDSGKSGKSGKSSKDDEKSSGPRYEFRTIRFSTAQDLAEYNALRGQLQQQLQLAQQKMAGLAPQIEQLKGQIADLTKGNAESNRQARTEIEALEKSRVQLAAAARSVEARSTVLRDAEERLLWIGTYLPIDPTAEIELILRALQINR